LGSESAVEHEAAQELASAIRAIKKDLFIEKR
jgi:hypothetical protein